jgi:hypothetical protein
MIPRCLVFLSEIVFVIDVRFVRNRVSPSRTHGALRLALPVSLGLLIVLGIAMLYARHHGLVSLQGGA